MEMHWKACACLVLLSLFGVVIGQQSPLSKGDGLVHEPGYCVMYDECAQNTANQKYINCLYNGKAKMLNDTKGLNLLQQVCPYLYNDSGPTYTCCSTNQLKTLEVNFQLPFQYLSRCPNCYNNFVALYCEMTCSPNQSVYTNVKKASNATTSAIINLKNETYVEVLNYTINNDFAYSMFNSCSHVSSPSTNAPAIKLMCGPYADSCTAHKWITYMNNIDNGLTPFQINVKYVDDPAVGMNYTTTPCNGSTATDGPCSCNDCPASCSGPPPKPPTPPEPWLIFNVDGYYVIMPMVYTAFLIIFLTTVFCMHMWCAKRKGGYGLDETCCTVVEDSTISAGEDDLGIRSNGIIKPIDSDEEPGLVESWGVKMEHKLQSCFRTWGTFCAKYPICVLIGGIIIVGAASAGLVFMTVTTDPVELWSAPTSQARQQKEYYDTHFGPFYRTEQLIITAPFSNRTIYTPYTDSTDPKDQVYIPFGSILRKDVLVEILALQTDVMHVKGEYKGQNISLNDICLKPLAPYNSNCTVMSVLNYFQNDLDNLNKEIMDDFDIYVLADYHDHLRACTSGPASIDDATKLHMSCLGTYGGPVFPWVALGGYDASNYLNATAAVITFPVINYHNKSDDNLGKALAWELAFVNFMKEYNKRLDTNLTVRFSSERSIEDEINRESGADVMTILFSYLIMFAYVAIALGKFGNCSLSRIMIDCQLVVGLSGVLIVLCSVAMSLGIFSYFGIPMTLIIVEVVPFLTLAVGVDNIFILVQHYQRDERDKNETPEQQLGRILGEVAPSMFMSSLSETIAFFLGGLSTMPAVRTFSMFAGLAVFCDFLLQISCFVAVLALDHRRRNGNRYDCLCCFRDPTQEEGEDDGILYWLTKHHFAPAVLSKFFRPFAICFFVALACFSGAVLHKVEIGLDQSLSMPSDSYVLDYFDGIKKYLSVGAPVYFVVGEGQNFTNADGANQVCGGIGCNNDSLIEQISFNSKMPNYSRIAYTASSWIDDYYDWLKPQSSCCRYYNSTSPHGFCNSTIVSDDCLACRSNDDVRNSSRPSPEQFMEFLPWFLQDNPNTKCGKGGHAAYASAVNLLENKTKVGATYYMAYHTVASTSSEFIACLEHANSMAASIGKNMSAEVFAYSVFYVFYEQYLTIVHDTIFNLGMSITAVFVVVFLLLGFDLISALIVVITILLILLDMFGIMFLWSIPLNAVSLVNLVMTVGISVEFCAHIVRAFALSQRMSRIKRAEHALAEMGSSVFSGITLTKFVGIAVLGFSTSQIFKVFYFRMYLCMVLLGFGHGLIFLPVLLSYIGPKRRRFIPTFKHARLLEEDDNSDGDTFPSHRRKPHGRRSVAELEPSVMHMSRDAGENVVNYGSDVLS